MVDHCDSCVGCEYKEQCALCETCGIKLRPTLLVLLHQLHQSRVPYEVALAMVLSLGFGEELIDEAMDELGDILATEKERGAPTTAQPVMVSPPIEGVH